MSITAIINPISGAGGAPGAAAMRVAMLQAEAARRGLSIDARVTERAGHARELAAAAASSGAGLVVVWGGDGTFNEAASALVGTGIGVGLVPAGSGNGFAAALGVPRDSAAAVAVALGGREKAVDAGVIAGRPFFNIAGVGFDARVARLFNARAAGTRGGWPYILIGVREGCRYCALEYDLQLDHDAQRCRALLIAFANGREYGMGARIAPGALLDDGLLDAVVVEERPVPARFWHARHLALGTAHRAPRVLTRRVAHAVIEAEGEIEFHVDGEPGVATGRVEVSVIPGALKVMVP